MQTNKTLIDSYFSANYDKITQIANNVLFKLHQTEFTSDLVNNSYIYLTSLDKELTKDNIEAIVVNYIHKQTVWTSTEIKNTFSPELIRHQDNYELSSEQFEFDDTPNFELKNQEVEDKLSAINKYMESLPLPKKKLFEIVYLDGVNTSGKLKKYFDSNGTTLARSTWWIPLKALRDDVKEKLITPIKNGHYSTYSGS